MATLILKVVLLLPCVTSPDVQDLFARQPGFGGWQVVSHLDEMASEILALTE